MDFVKDPESEIRYIFIFRHICVAQEEMEEGEIIHN